MTDVSRPVGLFDSSSGGCTLRSMSDYVLSESVLVIYPFLLVACLLLAARLQPRERSPYTDQNPEDARLER